MISIPLNLKVANSNANVLLITQEARLKGKAANQIMNPIVSKNGFANSLWTLEIVYSHLAEQVGAKLHVKVGYPLGMDG